MIRPACLSDALALRMLIQTEPQMWHESWPPDVLERALTAADGLAFVCEEQGILLGFICAHDVGFRGYLSLLIVAEDARGRGIGEQLLSRVQSELTERGCPLLIADVCGQAEAFYRRLGWQPPHAVLLARRLQ